MPILDLGNIDASMVRRGTKNVRNRSGLALALALAIAGLTGIVSPGAVTVVRADALDRLEGPALEAAFTAEGARTAARLSADELGNLPRVLPGIRAGLVLVRTDQGNLCRMLITTGLRVRPGTPKNPAMAAMPRPATPPANKPNANASKSDTGKTEKPKSETPKTETPKMETTAPVSAPLPVIVIERLDTFEPGRKTPRRLAQARDLVLFEGFRVDLDSAVVVPKDQGEDIVVQDQGLNGLFGVSLVTLTKKIQDKTGSGAGGKAVAVPSTDKKIVAADFAGAYQLDASGQWQGRLLLNVDDAGKVQGSFRSDRNGAVYPVEGTVSPRETNRVDFVIIFPQTRQEYEAYLWTEGKSALAGKVTMGNRSFGFHAARAKDE